MLCYDLNLQFRMTNAFDPNTDFLLNSNCDTIFSKDVYYFVLKYIYKHRVHLHAFRL